jgi:hypothetical protein
MTCERQEPKFTFGFALFFYRLTISTRPPLEENMGTVHIIKASGEVSQQTNVYAEPPREMLQAVVGGEWLEWVWVLFGGKRTRMIVNEVGGISEPQLPPNPFATAIYWANIIDQGRVPDADAAWIFGDVVLLDGIAVE